MSLEAKRDWETSSRSRGATYEVGKELALRAQRHTGLAWASNPELAASCRLSVRQVQRALRWLEIHGEIIRQPGGQRIYLIAPGAPQQPLPGLGGGDIAVSPPANGRGVTHGHPRGDTHAGATPTAVKTFNTTTPPEPPRLKRGGRTVDRSPVGKRRRRRTTEQCIPEPCPGPERLHSAWVPLEARLASALGEHWTIWGCGAHLHELEADELVLAFEPSTLSSVRRRFGERIALVLADRVVRLVGCEQIGARR